MKLSGKLALAAMMATLPMLGAFAQDDNDEVEAYLDADIVSQYMWRGIEKGGISIQPEAYVSWRGLTLRAEGNAGFNSADKKEIDLTLGYERWGFNIGVIDYWTSGVDKNDRYFYYDTKGPHQIEVNFGYSWKYGSLQAYTIVYGNDYRISGEKAYSTYVELSVPFKLAGLDWRAAVGGTPFESAGYDEVLTNQGFFGDETHYIHHYEYAEGPACVMASLRATKTLDLGIAHLPVFAELHTNPYLQTANFLVGVTIAPF
ncbi:MAG: hypothetical protein IJ559_01010 [Prevotella sp.]|nr:hypothetical protein [Prevotella sp.]